MARDFRSGSFLATESTLAEDADPRIGLVNLADVMLVFACGLMLALVTYWNLDVSAMQEVVKAEDVTEVTDVEQMQEQLSGAGTGYTELGMVYQDPMTGKLFMLTEDLEGTHTTQTPSERDEGGAAASTAMDTNGGAAASTPSGSQGQTTNAGGE
jgi:hypothetical protein